jgi:hypothetical protein
MRHLAFCLLICACGGLPEQQPQNGYQQCANNGLPLYCNTYAGPQRLLNGVPGECCTIGAGATSKVGYLCIYGNTSTSAGVCQDMPTIAAGCPQTGTLVRCCGGGPC